MQITQLINEKGKAVKNQFVVLDGEKVIFQSYDSKICEYNKQEKTLKLYGDTWDVSNTTRNHFKTFINNFTCFGYDTKDQFLKSIDGERIKTVS